MSWCEGERVVHPVWGLGTVRSAAGDEPVVVEFDRGGPAMIGERVEWLRRAEPEDLVPRSGPKFILESEDERHANVDRLMTVGAGPEWLGRELRAAFGSGHMRIPPADARTGLAAEALGALPRGYCVAFPERDAGILGTVRDGDPKELVGIAPFFDDGVRVPIGLGTVWIESNGVVARVSVSVGPAGLSFYDTRFCVQGHTYVDQPAHDAVLGGFAYTCGPAAAGAVDLPEEARARGLPGQLNLDGFAALLPAQGGDLDDYEFRGTIRDVRDVTFATGPMHRLIVTVIRDLDGWGDLDLPIFVAPAAWKGKRPPEAGRDVEGTLWLQGFLAPASDQR